MTNDEAIRLLSDALHEVAPEADVSTIDPDGLLQDELDLDSMDLLNIVIAIHERSGLDIPESDVSALTTFHSFVAYLVDRASV